MAEAQSVFMKGKKASFRDTGDRCYQRWADFKLMQLNATQPALFSFEKSPFTKEEFSLLLRERYLLYVNCIESQPGKEPKAPYLFQ